MARLNFITPFFIISSLEESLDFYTGRLGFEIWYTGPEENPYYAMIGRDAVSIMLKAISPDVKPLPNPARHEWARWDAYVNVPDPDELFEEYLSRGVIFRHPLKDTEDGLRGFELADADGYVLFFGRPLK